ncbi:DUF6933 domain-containing protein [Solitalea lacus]|uniref:DUF6933 domain-containing protein n=1 Tax=Solitalea lacus TaxID=2911172 RepID=UPI001EDA352A|nr:hypothetical protein [Solitalea lacus]UKJ07175.1 hypothetical protein L2B55_16810 [Solitalea lacus]
MFLRPMVQIFCSHLADFNALFTDGFINQLKFDQLIDDHQEIEIRKLYDKIVLSNTDNDKRVIGSMNDYVYNLKFMVADDGGIKNANPNMIGNLLNSTPMKAINYGFSIDRMRNEIKNQE